MKNTDQNIVSLADFKKARERLELKDVEEFIKCQQNELREFDQDIASHLVVKRQLKKTELLREQLATINARLLETSDWLDDELNAELDVTKTAAIERLRKIISQLVSRSEVTRKVLVDDMANSRYYEQRWLLDPAKFISFVFVAPVSVTAFIEKFITSKNHIGIHAGEGTIAVGLYLTFKSHADKMLDIAYKKTKQTPAKIRTLVVASALEMSVRAKPINEIQPRFPKERFGHERATIVLSR